MTAKKTWSVTCLKVPLLLLAWPGSCELWIDDWGFYTIRIEAFGFIEKFGLMVSG